ncbi:S1C family serine protease [Beijerinckia indica]|uniref:PDZ/DHR/GLGF domain protein n=1 Tax=Beijerinckia indica subsp. indica (strain ATCC 9039 / DSM 1715 / NCIMB 8712) TaxID=395963 RepID=B2IH33_BEII9|nr:S1C family serine protease [Beijerinckia indica]ACB94447.1 PDZ/DHR/GLGF domain protein [Beijerinckia indica subsp. indica ATCC 9039]
MVLKDEDWKIPPEAQPKQGNFRFDLEQTMSSIVSIRSRVPADAFTAGILGTERSGNGVLIDADGIVLTIGYLVTEAEEVWLTTNDGVVVAGHVLGIDPATGFALVQALGRLELPVMPLGESHSTRVGERVIIGGAGGVAHALIAHIVAKQEFAGYWEYVLDEALFTAPAHPDWGGAAMISVTGKLLGIGSLQVPHQVHGEQVLQLNMMVPIDLLGPIYADLRMYGRPNRPPRPWLGLFAAEDHDRIVVIGFAGNGPAKRAGLNEGDTILAVAGHPVSTLVDLFRHIWALGAAGCDVPLTLEREGDVFEVHLTSADRERYLKSASMH